MHLKLLPKEYPKNSRSKTFQKVSKHLQHYNLERVTNENDKEALKKDIYISKRKTENF